jgi:hypothetical protein
MAIKEVLDPPAGWDEELDASESNGKLGLPGKLPTRTKKEKSDGSSAGYYDFPEDAAFMQDLVSYRNMNAQIGEIFRLCYIYGNEELELMTPVSLPLPEDATMLQDLISFCNMNAQLGEVFRACFRMGHVEHSEEMRDAKKIKFYLDAELVRLQKYDTKNVTAIRNVNQMIERISAEINRLEKYA